MPLRNSQLNLIDPEQPVSFPVRIFALITRRAEIYVRRENNDLYELPGTLVVPGETPKQALTRLAKDLSQTDISAIGPKIHLESPNGEALCFPILTKQSMFDNWNGPALNLTWISKSLCEKNCELCGEALQNILTKFPNDSGNSYVFGETSSGTPTFFHLATGETLHGQVGPWEEAQNLYIPTSRIHEKEGHVTVHDLGLGCGTLALAVLDAFLQRSSITDLLIISYDLELEGIRSLLDNIDKFPFAVPFQDNLKTFLHNKETTLKTKDGRLATWKFIEGDFTKTSAAKLSTEEKANIVFLDFFSPKSHPHLWMYEVISNIFKNTAADGIVITSSGATATKAVLAASGFFVGQAPASGKRSFSTVAAKNLKDLENPLPAKWLKTFLASQAPFSTTETEESKIKIRKNLLCHSQFLETHCL